jgi:hypothetical protein
MRVGCYNYEVHLFNEFHYRTQRQHRVHSNFVSIKKTRSALHPLSRKTLRGCCRGYIPIVHNRDDLTDPCGGGVGPDYNKMMTSDRV